MKNKILKKVFIKLRNAADYQLNNFIAFIISRPSFYTINFYIYKKILLGLGINLNYDFKKSGEFNFIKKYLTRINKPIVFDVGANIGDYAKMIKEINNDSIIFAFEPHPLNFQMLKNNLNDIQNIFLKNIGLGKEKNKLYIYDYKNNDGSPRASIYKDVIEFMYSSETTRHDIEIDTLDNFVYYYNIKKINLLKIDTEGNELDVIKGGLNAINNGLIDVIQFEFNYTNIISHSFLYDFFNLLTNYDFYRILRKGIVKIANIPFNEIFLYQNIIAIRKNL